MCGLPLLASWLMLLCNCKKQSVHIHTNDVLYHTVGVPITQLKQTYHTNDVLNGTAGVLITQIKQTYHTNDVLNGTAGVLITQIKV